ncbi:MAG: bifunctional oligoribonuclease/PAP phosphatase NrnA [Clostridia bacterium]|nr:bifunctional oligoribonuclease/PAP phosphatase NrnA [Clostridia bacterium]
MKKFLKLMKMSSSVAIFAHEKPDADTIGSAVGLRRILMAMGKQVDMFCESDIPESFFFLEEAKTFNKKFGEYDLLISVDVATESMLGKYKDLFLNFSNTIKIDHHLNGSAYAKRNQVKPYSACAIAIYDIAEKLKVKIDEETATALYFGICGDTGIFRNNNTDSYTFFVASKLLEAGANIRRVYNGFFDKKTVPTVKISSSCLLYAETNDELGYAILKASKDDYEKYDVDPENDLLGNTPNTYLSCGYKIAVILKEKDDAIHCSLRSKLEYDVSKIAAIFGGGGHKNAAGCRIIATLEQAEDFLRQAIEKYLRSR